MSGVKEISSLDPLSEPLTEAHILHTKHTGTNNDERTTPGAILDLLLEMSANGDTVTGSNVLYSENDSGERVKITVDDILDLVVAMTNIQPPSKAVPIAADKVVIADSEDSGFTKFIEFSEVKELMASLYFNYTRNTPGKAGTAEFFNWNVADPGNPVKLQVRWGRGVSTLDTEESFAFESPFTTECQICIITVQGLETKYALSQGTEPTKDNFFINRSNDINGNIPFHYVAIGF